MAVSQNGRLVLESYGGPLVAKVIPGTDGIKFLGGVLNGDVDTILRYVGHRWHTEVEPVDSQAAGQWGYGFRAIRGQSSGFSNHASGTAVDINATKHPLGTRTLSPTQREKIQRIALALRGVVRFGVFYTGRVDEMHAEILGSDSTVAQVATAIRQGALPNVPDELRTSAPRAPGNPAPTVPDAPPSEEDELNEQEKARLENVEAILGRLQNAIGDPDNGVFANAAAAKWAAQEAKDNAGNAATIAGEVRNLILDPDLGVLAALRALQAKIPN